MAVVVLVLMVSRVFGVGGSGSGANCDCVIWWWCWAGDDDVDDGAVIMAVVVLVLMVSRVFGVGGSGDVLSMLIRFDACRHPQPCRCYPLTAQTFLFTSTTSGRTSRSETRTRTSVRPVQGAEEEKPQKGPIDPKFQARRRPVRECANRLSLSSLKERPQQAGSKGRQGENRTIRPRRSRACFV